MINFDQIFGIELYRVVLGIELILCELFFSLGPSSRVWYPFQLYGILQNS